MYNERSITRLLLHLRVFRSGSRGEERIGLESRNPVGRALMRRGSSRYVREEATFFRATMGA